MEKDQLLPGFHVGKMLPPVSLIIKTNVF